MFRLSQYSKLFIPISLQTPMFQQLLMIVIQHWLLADRRGSSCKGVAGIAKERGSAGCKEGTYLLVSRRVNTASNVSSLDWDRLPSILCGDPVLPLSCNTNSSQG